MSAALINRSLTNVRTELEFLYDSEVIDQSLFDTLMASLPRKYAKDMAPWGVDKIPQGSSNKTPDNNEKIAAEDALSQSLQKASLRDQISTPPNPIPAAVPVPRRAPAPALGYCKASYNYDSSESGDLRLAQGDRLAVLEHLSPDWWKGYKKGGSPAEAGVFPSNYVTVISETEFEASAGPEIRPAPSPEKSSNYNEKASYDANAPTSAPPMYHQDTNSSNGGYQQGYQAVPQQQQQPTYGGYSQFPPPSTNYYGQQQMQPQQYPQQQQYPQEQQVAPQESSGSNGAQHFKKFGSKLGNAAIFGAGATIGSDIVNSIF